MISPNNINFSEIFKDMNLGDFNNYSISKYKTNDVLFNANIKAVASAYIDFYNNDNEIDSAGSCGGKGLSEGIPDITFFLPSLPITTRSTRGI